MGPVIFVEQLHFKSEFTIDQLGGAFLLYVVIFIVQISRQRTLEILWNNNGRNKLFEKCGTGSRLRGTNVHDGAKSNSPALGQRSSHPDREGLH